MNRSNILVVDDEPMVLSSLQRLLEDEYEVFAADNGDRALELIKQHPIKVVISDQRMPKMIGSELLKRVKEISPQTVRILLTGYSDLDAVMDAVNTGEIFRYISKPWRADRLINVVALAVQIYDKLAAIHEIAGEESVRISVELIPADAKSPKPQLHIPPVPPVPPVSVSPVSQSVEKPVEKPPEKLGSVLIVNRDAAERQHIAALLERSFTVYSTASPDEAFAHLAQHGIGVLISDVVLEKHDGMDFLRVVKQDYPHVITMILTSLRDAALAVRAINELHVHRYITKPFDESRLENVVREATEKHKLYTAKPMANAHFSANAIAPEPLPDKPEMSDLRMKLLAAKMRLSNFQNRT